MNFTFTIILALILELLGIILRFGFNINKKTTYKYTKININYVYSIIGMITTATGIIIKNLLLTNVGIAILLSFAIHHLIIMPLTKK